MPNSKNENFAYSGGTVVAGSSNTNQSAAADIQDTGGIGNKEAVVNSAVVVTDGGSVS